MARRASWIVTFSAGGRVSIEISAASLWSRLSLSRSTVGMVRINLRAGHSWAIPKVGGTPVCETAWARCVLAVVISPALKVRLRRVEQALDTLLERAAGTTIA